MGKLAWTNGKAAFLLKALLVSYLITGILLLILAFLLYQFDLTEEIISIGIIVIYSLTTFIGGFYIGRKKKNKKFLWGLIFGGCYFLLLMIVSLALNHGMPAETDRLFTTSVICICGGTFGGMLA
ncbi:MAG: TIGR04086 family membrane protein [Clostridia bacterium]|nr:TIGR04086 family membrane protein [Clostridia bacterium]